MGIVLVLPAASHEWKNHDHTPPVLLDAGSGNYVQRGDGPTQCWPYKFVNRSGHDSLSWEEIFDDRKHTGGRQVWRSREKNWASYSRKNPLLPAGGETVSGRAGRPGLGNPTGRASDSTSYSPAAGFPAPREDDAIYRGPWRQEARGNCFKVRTLNVGSSCSRWGCEAGDSLPRETHVDSRGLTQTHGNYQIRNWKRMGPFEQAHTQASEQGEPYKPTRTDKTQNADSTPLWRGRAAPGVPTRCSGKAKRRQASKGSLAASYRPQKCFTISPSNCPPWY